MRCWSWSRFALTRSARCSSPAKRPRPKRSPTTLTADDDGRLLVDRGGEHLDRAAALGDVEGRGGAHLEQRDGQRSRPTRRLRLHLERLQPGGEAQLDVGGPVDRQRRRAATSGTRYGDGLAGPVEDGRPRDSRPVRKSPWNALTGRAPTPAVSPTRARAVSVQRSAVRLSPR